MKKALALLFAAAALVGCNQESSTETGTRSSRTNINEGAGAPGSTAPSSNAPSSSQSQSGQSQSEQSGTSGQQQQSGQSSQQPQSGQQQQGQTTP